MGKYAENGQIRWHTFSHTEKGNKVLKRGDWTIFYIFVQGWKYGDRAHNSAGKLRAVRFVASKIGDESLECPLAKTSLPPLTSTEQMIRKGKKNRQDIATFTITVYYTKALG